MSGKEKCANLKFGLDGKDAVRWIFQLDLQHDVGSNCGLHCAVCGEPLIAVRENVNDPLLCRFHYLRHESGSLCSGTSESAVHKAAKYVAAELCGKKIRLPAVSIADAVPHESRYLDSGKRKKLRVRLPASSSCILQDHYVKGSSRFAKIDKVRIEPRSKGLDLDGAVPDAMIRVNGEWIDLEFRMSHKKTTEDVCKCARRGIGVIEIFLGDIPYDADDLHDILLKRIAGLANGGNRLFGREWLYHPGMRRDLVEKWHLEKRKGPVEQPEKRCVIASSDAGTLLVAEGAPKSDSQSLRFADTAWSAMEDDYERRVAKEKAEIERKRIELEQKRAEQADAKRRHDKMIESKLSVLEPPRPAPPTRLPPRKHAKFARLRKLFRR